MKDLTTQFLDFLDATPDKVYDTSDGNGCAYFQFLQTLGVPVTCVGVYGVWGPDTERIMDVPDDIRPFHYNSFTFDSKQTFGKLAERIREYRTIRNHNWGENQPHKVIHTYGEYPINEVTQLP